MEGEAALAGGTPEETISKFVFDWKSVQIQQLSFKSIGQRGFEFVGHLKG